MADNEVPGRHHTVRSERHRVEVRADQRGVITPAHNQKAVDLNASLKIELQPVTAADVEIFFEHQADTVASAMAAFPSRDLEGHREHWSKLLADPSKITRAIVVDGVVAGNIGSWVSEGEREIGYWIGRENWGRGIATAALILFLDEVEERPLVAWVAEHNGGSIR